MLRSDQQMSDLIVAVKYHVKRSCTPACVCTRAQMLTQPFTLSDDSLLPLIYHCKLSLADVLSTTIGSYECLVTAAGYFTLLN
jgi:hypothetical protein